MRLLNDHIQTIHALCDEHKVKSLYVFGSVLTSSFDETNDVDMIVDFNAIDIADYFDNYYDLKFSLETLLQKPIDLLESQTIKNPYFKREVDKHKQLIYGK